jgi:hypothetical protein
MDGIVHCYQNRMTGQCDLYGQYGAETKRLKYPLTRTEVFVTPGGDHSLRDRRQEATER